MTIQTMHQLSWCKINLFYQCPHCFYKVVNLKLKRPDSDPDCFALNNAVDTLLKSEFDLYREQQKVHPLMIAHKVKAVPYDHNLLPIWRDYRAGGIRFCDRINDLELCGVIDDVLINDHEELILIDFKASVKGKYRAPKWDAFNRLQLSFYANLFRRNGYPVHKTGYFVYANALKDMPRFDQTLNFEMSLQGHVLDESWIDPTMKAIRKCLNLKRPPAPSKTCSFCRYDLSNECN